MAQQQQYPANEKFQILSPDGITITFGQAYHLGKDVNKDLKEFAERYRSQGYYRDNNWRQIPVDDIPNYCSVIPYKS